MISYPRLISNSSSSKNNFEGRSFGRLGFIVQFSKKKSVHSRMFVALIYFCYVSHMLVLANVESHIFTMKLEL